MADAKLKKMIGYVTKLIFFCCIYRKYVILTCKTACNPSIFINIYDFSEVMVKYYVNQ